MPNEVGRRDFDPEEFIRRIDRLEEAIPEEVGRFPVKSRIAKRVLDRIRALIDRLTALYRALDPVEHSDIYDPSHPESVAELIAEKLIRCPPIRLDQLTPFWGSGVYALYYTGDHPAYQRISNRPIPIYVGKADPAIPTATTAREQGQKLYDRLVRDHARSIRAAERYATGLSEEDRDRLGIWPIRVEDFQCRYLVLASAYAGAVERVLIAHFKPVWNNETGVCIGFGKHGDRAETRRNTRSDWDTIHPGRPWATGEENVPNPRSALQVQADIIAHCVSAYGEADATGTDPLHANATERLNRG